MEGETWSENNSDRFALLSEREKGQVRLGMSIKSLRSSYSKRLLVNRSTLTCIKPAPSAPLGVIFCVSRCVSVSECVK